LICKGEAQRLFTLPSQTDAADSQELRDNREIMRVLRDRLAARQELLPDLADQLRAALLQTENAVLEISEKFMNIAGRARSQLKATTQIVGTLEQDRPAATGSHAELTATAKKISSTLTGLTAETGMLGKDINGIITSLQFQDITRQQIEKVISRISQFQQELIDMKRSLEPGSASTPGPEGLCVAGRSVNRGEHVQDISDR